MNSKPRILVLGGGTGGTLVSNMLAKKLRADEAEIFSQDAERPLTSD